MNQVTTFKELLMTIFNHWTWVDEILPLQFEEKLDLGQMFYVVSYLTFNFNNTGKKLKKLDILKLKQRDLANLNMTINIDILKFEDVKKFFLDRFNRFEHIEGIIDLDEAKTPDMCDLINQYGHGICDLPFEMVVLSYTSGCFSSRVVTESKNIREQILGIHDTIKNCNEDAQTKLIVYLPSNEFS